MTDTAIHPIAEATPADTAFPLLRVSAACLLAGAGLFAAAICIVPGPDVAGIHDAGWTPGHFLNAAAYLVLLLGLPALGAALHRRISWAGAVGLAALAVRLVLSTGSQLYYARIEPALAPVAQLHHRLQPGGRVASIYGGWDDAINLVLAVLFLGMVWELWRRGRQWRGPAVVLGICSVGMVTFTPAALLGFIVFYAWVGLRLVRGR